MRLSIKFDILVYDLRFIHIEGYYDVYAYDSIQQSTNDKNSIELKWS